MEILKIANPTPKTRKEACKQLQEILFHLPDEPGVYLMRNKDSVAIYIGKAKSLRIRVRSYFRSNLFDGRRQTQALVRNVWSLDYIVTDTEVEALILEANLVKKHKPRYNINLKDDKKYPFIKITKEPFPRILVTRDIERDGSKYMGPFSDVKSLRKTLATMHKLFKVRSCDHALPCKGVRLCLDYEIDRCDGPCEGKISQDEYKLEISEAILFLKGRNTRIIKTLREKMKTASKTLRFEEAASLRDRLKALEHSTKRQKVVSPDLTDWDSVALAIEDNEACGVVLEIRDGRLIGKNHYFLGNVKDSPTEEVISAFLRLYYASASFVPKEITIRNKLRDKKTILEWLRDKSKKLVEIRIPQRGDKARLLRMAETNASLLLTERRLKRENQKNQIPRTIASLKRDLHLEQPPKRIEAMDISNIRGMDPVASLVCFIEGRPRKGDYRHYRIKNIPGPDDYAMMKQVVTRRFKRLIKEDKPFPDLLLIDGGKGQLSSAGEALKNLGIENQPIVGLAKRLEEVFLPGFSNPQNISKTSSSLRLLQQIRDESHRFAVSYHRKLRKKRIISSSLDSIEGIGPRRRTLLLKHFGSVKRLMNATQKEIGAIPSIGMKLADKIYNGLHS